jgi:hypothetical protein
MKGQILDQKIAVFSGKISMIQQSETSDPPSLVAEISISARFLIDYQKN